MPKGFTLIELLVVIVIIGILATIAVGSYNNFIKEAEIAKDLSELSQQISKLKVQRLNYQSGGLTAQELMEADLKVVEKAIIIGRKKQEKKLIDITQKVCSDCACRNKKFEEPYSTGAQSCINSWENIMNTLKTATDIDISFLKTDPWGSPYLVDENEGEFNDDYCRKDRLSSAGPDKTFTEDGDDYSILLEFYQKSKCN